MSMASKELQDYVNHAKKLIENGQLDYSIADALYQASQVAMKTEKDNEYGLKVLSYAKYVCRQVVRREQNCSICDFALIIIVKWILLICFTRF